MSFKAVNSYGMDAELAQRMAAKYDNALEEKVQVWIETVTGTAFDKPFGDMLDNGVLLCELVNALLPRNQVKKINRTGGLFRMQENITNFIKVCRAIGVPEPSLFPTESLAQQKDVGQVLTCINAFASTVQKKRTALGVTYDGPFLGPAPKAGAEQKRVTKKWTVKPGGSAGVSKLNQGSAGVMQPTKYVDAREQIKRNQLDGAGSGGVSMLNNGSAGIMEESKYVDAREQIKRNQLDGAGSGGVSMLNNGSAGIMEENKYVDAREQIKRNQLDGAGTGSGSTKLDEATRVMERQQYSDVRENIKRGEM